MNKDYRKMTERMIERPELAEYLPHKDSMLLIDRIVSYDLENSVLVAEVDTDARDLFYTEALQGIPAWIGFEYMAQSIAAFSGVGARGAGHEPRIGFIMSVRAFRTELPAYPAGKTLSVRVSQVFRDESVVSFDCAISLDDRTVTTAVINAIEVENPELFLRRDE